MENGFKLILNQMEFIISLLIKKLKEIIQLTFKINLNIHKLLYYLEKKKKMVQLNILKELNKLIKKYGQEKEKDKLLKLELI